MSKGTVEQNGNGNPVAVKVPLPEWAEGLIDLALARHMANCPMRKRVETLEIRLASLVAFMVGAGLLGGGAGALVARLVH